MQRQELDRLSREELIVHAERLGVPRPRVLTQPELIDEILGRTVKSEREKARARGWLGRARDLLARVVEKGLHLPEAARVLRSSPDDKPWPAPPPPLPTVTLAEIYAAQGHLERAVATLDEVLAREPEHAEAKALRARFAEQSRARRGGGRGASAASEGKGEAAKKDATATENATANANANATATETANATATETATGTESAETAKDETAREEEEPPTEAADPDPPGAAAEEEEAPALPDRYDVDEIVAIAVDPRRIYLYWEVRATTLARAQAKKPDGFLGVRVACVTASWEGPVVKVRDLRVDALYGDRFVRDMEPGSNIRVSVGWRSGDDFEPFAVGIDVTAPHLGPSDAIAGETGRWTPDAAVVDEGLRAPPFDERAPGGARHAAAPAPAWPIFAGATGGGRRRPAAAPPADTGVESWGGAPSANLGVEVLSFGARTEDEEPAWILPGGASELGRSGPGRVRRTFGGASELSFSGAGPR
jgi:hypothetical protein